MKKTIFGTLLTAGLATGGYFVYDATTGAKSAPTHSQAEWKQDSAHIAHGPYFFSTYPKSLMDSCNEAAFHEWHAKVKKYRPEAEYKLSFTEDTQNGKKSPKLFEVKKVK